MLGPNNSDSLQNWFRPDIRSPLLNLQKFQGFEKSIFKSCRMCWNRMNEHEFASRKLLKLKYRRGWPNNSHSLQNWFPPEISSPIFNLKIFQDCEESTPQSCRMHWNLMNENEFGTINLLKLKYRRGDQIIQSFCKIRLPQILGPPSLFCRILKTLRKVPLNHKECIDI